MVDGCSSCRAILLTETVQLTCRSFIIEANWWNISLKKEKKIPHTITELQSAINSIYVVQVPFLSTEVPIQGSKNIFKWSCELLVCAKNASNGVYHCSLTQTLGIIIFCWQMFCVEIKRLLSRISFICITGGKSKWNKCNQTFIFLLLWCHGAPLVNKNNLKASGARFSPSTTASISAKPGA